jgi:hypothetical protein
MCASRRLGVRLTWERGNWATEERLECKNCVSGQAAEENGVVQFDGKRVPRCNLPVFIVTKRNLTGKSMLFL